MIVAPSGSGVQQIYTAFFATGNHQFLALVVKDRWSDLHIEVALSQPGPVRGLKPVLQLQFVADDLYPNQTVAIDVILGIVNSVAGGRPGGSAQVDSRARAAPHATAFRIKGHHFLRRIVNIDGPHLVRIAVAAL